jgi:hypothetical protein
MRGLEVPPAVVGALGGGARPPVTITINGHSWKSRVAIMRGRHLIGLSNANREAAHLAAYDGLAHTHRRAIVLGIESAKKAETRARRIASAIAKLRNGSQDH